MTEYSNKNFDNDEKWNINLQTVYKKPIKYMSNTPSEEEVAKSVPAPAVKSEPIFSKILPAIKSSKNELIKWAKIGSVIALVSVCVNLSLDYQKKRAEENRMKAKLHSELMMKKIEGTILKSLKWQSLDEPKYLKAAKEVLEIDRSPEQDEDAVDEKIGKSNYWAYLRMVEVIKSGRKELKDIDI